MPAIPKFTPCLWFNHNAEDAVAHYLDVFGNGSILETLRYGENHPELQGKVLVLRFELHGQHFLALNAGSDFPFTPAISISVDCEDQAEVDDLWTKLTEGGADGECGWVTDRFGLSWQITPRALSTLMADPDPAKAARAMAAMMTMRKIDVAQIEAAAE